MKSTTWTNEKGAQQTAMSHIETLFECIESICWQYFSVKREEITQGYLLFLSFREADKNS